MSYYELQGLALHLARGETAVISGRSVFGLSLVVISALILALNYLSGGWGFLRNAGNPSAARGFVMILAPFVVGIYLIVRGTADSIRLRMGRPQQLRARKLARMRRSTKP